MGALARSIGDPDGAELLDWLGDYIAALSANGVANLSLAYSVGSSALTIAAKQQGGSNGTADQPIIANMRSATATSGDYNVRSIEAALSLVVSSGSTLGQANSDTRWTYVYLIEDGSTNLELAVSSKFFGLQGIVSTTAEGGAGAADSATVMYSTTARSNTPYLCVGRFKGPQTAAGTWAAVPTSAEAWVFQPDATPGDFTVGGNLLAPAKSAFLATLSAQQDNKTGNGAAYTVICDAEPFDQAADYNSSTGVYTARATGKHRFDANVHVIGLTSAATGITLQLVTSNRTLTVSQQTLNLGGAGERSIGISALMDMDAGDTAYLVVTVSGMAGDTADIYHQGYTFFSGSLEC